MRVAVIGAGAMGGMFGARLSEVGHDVLLVDVARQLVDHVNAHGLVVESEGEQTTFALEATTTPADNDPVDVIVVFVKGYHTASAMELAEPLVTSSTIVVTLQNGWGNADTIASVTDPGRIVVGVTNNSATVRELGRVAHTGRGVTYVGPYDETGSPAHAELIAELLGRAGFEVEVRRRVRLEIWNKLVLNAATLPTAALTGMTAGALGEPGPMRDLVDDVAREAVEVAQANGYQLSVDERIGYIHQLLAGAGSGKASMLQDFEAARQTEIDTINGAVVAMGERAGVKVALNRALVALVKGYERTKGLT